MKDILRFFGELLPCPEVKLSISLFEKHGLTRQAAKTVASRLTQKTRFPGIIDNIIGKTCLAGALSKVVGRLMLVASVHAKRCGIDNEICVNVIAFLPKDWLCGKFFSQSYLPCIGRCCNEDVFCLALL